MDFKQGLLENLESLLNETSQKLASSASPDINQCGSCTACCQAKNLTTHRVSEMEYALMEDRVSLEVAGHFREYIDRKTDGEGELVHALCPNLGEKVCTVYAVRPFSCRIFGHVREEGTRLPDGCVFTGHEKVTKKSEYYTEIPGTARLRKLWREFQLLVALPDRAPDSPTSIQLELLEDQTYVNHDDPLDRTLEHVARQRYEEALGELVALDPATETAARTELWGMTLASLGRHPEALAKYESLLEQVPPRADFLYQAGCAAFLSGDVPKAQEYWDRSYQMSPTYSPSLGMLGYLSNMLEEWPEAIRYFLLALDHDPLNPFFHLRVGEALVRNGDYTQARAHLQQSQLHPATQEPANEWLARLEGIHGRGP